MANAALIAIPLVIGSLGFVALAFPADAGLNRQWLWFWFWLRCVPRRRGAKPLHKIRNIEYEYYACASAAASRLSRAISAQFFCASSDFSTIHEPPQAITFLIAR